MRHEHFEDVEHHYLPYQEEGGRFMHEQVGASRRLNSRTNPSSEDEHKFEREFHELYAEAWKSGIRDHHLKSWASKVAETLSGGETKFNGCYGGKGYNVDLQRKITEAALRLRKEFDTKLRVEAGGATPDLVLSNGSQHVFADLRRVQNATLYYTEVPLRSDWEVSEYDGIESLIML
ncbi:hypothetical protein RQP46_011094 [Phenoliferia psychrophenolica]